MKKITKILSLGLLLLSGVSFAVAGSSKVINEAKASSLTNDGYDTNDYHYYSGTYYDSIGNSAISTGGTTLLSALCTKIQPSSEFGYNSLWSLYATSDIYPNNYDGTDPLTGNSYPTTKSASGYRGKIWDMYGDTQYTVGGSAQGANYSKVGDAYNREHTVPQSWFGENSIPKSDPHHIFATDGYVNNQRGNHPYGDVNGNPTVLTNGFGGTGSPVGTYGSCGDSTVFEPEDAYKGDIARAVLYMAAAYYNYGTSFATSNSCFTRSGNNNLLSSYYINLLTKWSAEDPVSQKEIDRNNVIYSSSQANRNPFIDHPNWAYKIWGGTQYTWNNGSTPSTDPSATISPSSASVQVGKTVSLTATLSNVANAGNITWDSSDTSKATVEKGTTSTSSSAATVTGVAAGSATISCKHSGTTIGSVTVTVTSSDGSGSSSDYSLYSGSITEGDYIIYYDGKAMNTTVTSDRLQYEAVTPTNDVISNPASSIVWHIAASGDYWTLYNSVANAYAASTGAKNKAQMLASGSDNKSLWTITGTSTYEFVNKQNVANDVNANLRENGTYGFACYATATGGALSLYKAGSGSSTPADPTSISASVNKTYYVGETISISDITVTDNNSNNITGFIFANDGYKFTYDDAESGGSLTDKDFAESVTYGTLKCDLKVQVRRKAYVAPSSSTKSVSYTDLPTSYQTSTSERTASNGIKYIAYNLANYSSKMQFKANGGYFQTTEALNLLSLTINNRETNTLTVYGSSDGSSFKNTITGTDDVYDLSGYSFVKVMKNGSGAAYCSSLTIVVGSSESAENVANYIMYEDTTNQCTSKFTTAKGYFENLSKANRATFMTSEDYVISIARARLVAWAAHEGKSITLSDGDYVIASNSGLSFAIKANNDTTSIVVIIVSLLSITALGGFLFIKHKKEER